MGMPVHAKTLEMGNRIFCKDIPPTFFNSDVMMSAGSTAKLGPSAPSAPCESTPERLAAYRDTVAGVFGFARVSQRARPLSAVPISPSAYCQRHPAFSRWPCKTMPNADTWSEMLTSRARGK